MQQWLVEGAVCLDSSATGLACGRAEPEAHKTNVYTTRQTQSETGELIGELPAQLTQLARRAQRKQAW
eukprot:2294937-Alexandrium_andersonii.AAC.1